MHLSCHQGLFSLQGAAPLRPRNEKDDDDDNDETNFGDGEDKDGIEEDSAEGQSFVTLIVDANTEFRIKRDLAGIMNTLRGCVHGAVQ